MPKVRRRFRPVSATETCPGNGDFNTDAASLLAARGAVIVRERGLSGCRVKTLAILTIFILT